jgi:hypothetical protein
MPTQPPIDEIRLIGNLLIECLRGQTPAPIILQYEDDDALCRVTFPARGQWRGARTFRGRGPLEDAALAALAEAAQALRAERPAEPRPRG